jgi:hypothetical protein
MAEPTYQDATLMLQLAQLGAAWEIPEVESWLRGDPFVPDYKEFVKKYSPGGDWFAKALRICSRYETVGTLVHTDRAPGGASVLSRCDLHPQDPVR